MSTANSAAESALAYLQAQHASSLGYWRGLEVSEPESLQDICDTVYSLRLLGRMDELSAKGVERFCSRLRKTSLAGALTETAGKATSVHLTAYALATLNLLRPRFPFVYEKALLPARWRLDELINPRTLRPRWPAQWTHHSWRVSHWIGGAPSILLSLSRALPDEYRDAGGPDLGDVLERCDSLLDVRTGFLRPYRSAALHALFNTLYSLRHDTVAGEVGGVVHLHWVNYAVDRAPFVGANALAQTCQRLLSNNIPFMESTPYCLDFDVVHLLRTASGSIGAPIVDGGRKRLERYCADLERFFNSELGASYKLHRLPGAIATAHECALAMRTSRVPGLGVESCDVIKEAYWL